MEPADLSKPAYQKLPRLMWSYMKFLYGGCKETWKERKERARVLDTVQDGRDALSWREYRFVRRVKSDLIK